MLLDALQSRSLLRCALEERFAILAVNADSPAAITDCLEAALATDAPIIVETSLWQLVGWSFGAGDPLLGMARYLVDLGCLASSARYRGIPILFHTDHIKGPDTLRILKSAVRGLPVDVGGARVMVRPSTISLDSSELSGDENIAAICALCAESRACGAEATLEMEAGVDDGVTPLEIGEQLLGGVERAHPGKVWIWAPGVGTKHGFSEKGYPAFSPRAVANHRELARKVTGRDVGIALHGSSGVPEESLREAVGAGVIKVNWSSESLWIRSQAARDFYEEHRERLEKSHAQFKATAMDNGVQAFVSARYIPKVIERIRILGGVGKAAAFQKRAGG